MLKRLPLLVMVVAGLAGCGGSDEEQDGGFVLPREQRAILRTVEDLQTASRQGDAGRICSEIFTKTLAESIRRAAKRSCKEEVRATLVSPDTQLSVGREIHVNGSNARATLRERNGDISTVFLRKLGQRWKIERIKPLRS